MTYFEPSFGALKTFAAFKHLKLLLFAIVTFLGEEFDNNAILACVVSSDKKVSCELNWYLDAYSE